VETSQSFKVPSSLPDRATLPSGEKATAPTFLECPVCTTAIPAARSQEAQPSKDIPMMKSKTLLGNITLGSITF
jgi:hypothetical protein